MHWSDSTSIQSLESHSICSPCCACQILHEGKWHLGSGFCFLGLLFPCQLPVESDPQVGGVVLSKQSLTVYMQVGLLFLCWKAEDSIGGLPGVDFDKPLFCLTFQFVQCLLQSIVCSCKVFLWAPQDQIVGVYGTQDFTRRISYDVVDEDKE